MRTVVSFCRNSVLFLTEYYFIDSSQAWDLMTVVILMSTDQIFGKTLFLCRWQMFFKVAKKLY